ncbi:hypothetical protein F3J27_03540 [Enterobacter sp. Ap-916]|nr:hypothetical protein [Enterobacter sp. Ap-867]NIG28558.1 hypothetical protein [Enterobacter sp. Ap-916]
MRIDELSKLPRSQLPRMYRVVEVDLDVLRNCIGEGGGVIFDCDTVVKRRVRRVLNEKGGWRWAMVEVPGQREWDYCLSIDKEYLHELNYELGLLN